MNDSGKTKPDFEIEKIQRSINMLHSVIQTESEMYCLHQETFEDISDSLNLYYSELNAIKHQMQVAQGEKLAALRLRQKMVQASIVEENKNLSSTITNKNKILSHITQKKRKIKHQQGEINKLILIKLLTSYREKPVETIRRTVFLGYIGFTFIGFLSSVIYYAYFKINIINYVEWSYFLLAGLQSIGSYLLILFLLLFLAMVKNAANFKNFTLVQLSVHILRRPLEIGFATILIIMVMIDGINAFQIKKATSPDSIVITSRPIQNWKNLVHVGHTGKFAFFGLPGPGGIDSDRILIIPIQNITCFSHASGGDIEITPLVPPKILPSENKMLVAAARELTSELSQLSSLSLKGLKEIETTVKGLPKSVMELLAIQKSCDVQVWHHLEKRFDLAFVDISKPFIFDRGQKNWIPDEHSQTYLKAFLDKHQSKDLKFMLIGMASPDGSETHNHNLGADRAHAIQEKIKDLGYHLDNRIRTESLGEDHFINTFSNSRCVRIAVYQDLEFQI